MTTILPRSMPDLLLDPCRSAGGLLSQGKAKAR
jgi:hypothetical protein